MRRAVSLLLSGALLFGLLAACGKDAGGEVSDPPAPPSEKVRETPPAEEGPAEDGPAALEAVNAVFTASGFEGTGADVEYLTMGSGEFLTAYLENAYKLDWSWEDAAVIRGTGASAFELAVLRMEDETAAVQAAAALMSYIFARQGDFAGYAPAQADMAANGGVAQSGRYAGLFICPDPEGAETAFQSIIDGESAPVLPMESEPVWDSPYDPDFPDRIRFVQPNKDDMSLYDTGAILAAWEMGDPSRLSGDDREIYDAARDILEAALEEGMTDLEKETALYSWMVNHVDYDWTHQNFFLRTPRTSFTPYGPLVDHTAVCLGYATGFQLLMDLAGVECITVVGAAFQSREDHGWNMVRLDGEWYCLDVTWDANYREQGVTKGREQDWDFFNVTSDYMAATNHQWDYANTPEAVGQDDGFTAPAGGWDDHAR